MSKNENIIVDLKEGIGSLVLNRPESRNAITKQMWLDIPRKLQELEKQGARIVVIEGANGAFAAGADIMELKDIETLEDASSSWSAISAALNFVADFSLPVVAAIDGPCLGGGCLLACACDLRYASHRSSFAVPVARLGIALDDANLFRLSNLIGSARAKELIFRARVLSAEEAYSWGLVNEVYAEQEFAAMKLFILAEIIAGSPLTLKETKASFNRIFGGVAGANTEQVVASYLGEDFSERIAQALKKN